MTEENAVINLSVSYKLLAEFKVNFAEETLPDVATKDGYKFIKEGIALVRSHRTGTEKLRQQLVKPLNDRVKEINKTCKDMEEELKWIEGPMKRVKDDEDERLQAIKDEEERQNRLRIAKITERCEAIRNEPLEAMEMTSDQIQERIEILEAMDTDEGFDEFSETAQEFVITALGKLRSLRETKALAEQQAIEQAERDRLQIEADEKARQEAVEAERVRKQEIADQEAENSRKADELAEKERVLNEKMVAIEKAESDKKYSEFTGGAGPIDEAASPLPPVDDTEKVDAGSGEENTPLIEAPSMSIFITATKDSIDLINALVDDLDRTDTPFIGESIVEAVQAGSIPHIHWEIK